MGWNYSMAARTRHLSRYFVFGFSEKYLIGRSSHCLEKDDWHQIRMQGGPLTTIMVSLLETISNIDLTSPVKAGQDTFQLGLVPANRYLAVFIFQCLYRFFPTTELPSGGAHCQRSRR